MEQKEINTNSPPKSEDMEKVLSNKWDAFSITYYEFINKCTLSLMTTLIALGRNNNKYKILDAGCGPGLGTRLISLMTPSSNCTIYACDFSSEMIKLSKKVFSEFNDFNANIHNHWEIVDYSKTSNLKINIDKDTEETRHKKTGKVVKFFQGNVENLIFEDEQFDSYISNLCLMLCSDPDKAIKEMYRVLKPGGTSTVSVWGKKEDTKIAFVLFNEVFSRHGVKPPAGSKTSFDLAKDPEQLKKKFLDAGFREVRMEYMNVIFDCYNSEDFLTIFQGPGVKDLTANIKDDMKVKAMLEEVKERADEELNKGAIPLLNCMVIYALK